jgi:prefoldin subunit 5
LNDQLNDTVAELKEQNQFLKEQVDTFADLNQDLNSTVIDLNNEVDRLEGQVSNFTKENDRLEDLVGSLSDETDTLTELSNVLQENVDRLKGEVGNLKTENGRLETSIDNLKTVIEFWGDVVGNIDNTYEEMTAFLAQQISTNRNLVLEALENTYHQRVADWDCGLRAQYALEPFAQDDSVSIPNDKYNEVIDFVNGRVLSDLCLSRSNFESYVTSRYPSGGISIDRLVTSVRRYTWDAIDHYFPEIGEDGLTPENWSMANFTCSSLMPSQKYSV